MNNFKLENQQIYFIEKNVTGTLAIENAYPSICGRIVTRNFLMGKITSKEAIQRIKRLYGVRT